MNTFTGYASLVGNNRKHSDTNSKKEPVQDIRAHLHLKTHAFQLTSSHGIDTKTTLQFWQMCRCESRSSNISPSPDSAALFDLARAHSLSSSFAVLLLQLHQI